MRSLIILLFFFICLVQVQAQLSDRNLLRLQDAELSLRDDAMRMFLDSTEEARHAALRTFIPQLVQTLKLKGSYAYPFDSLRGISIVQPEDKSFRMFTWQFLDDGYNARHYGAIQFETEKGLKLIPLFDQSDTMQFQTQQILGSSNWFGAVYYKIMQQKVKGKTYYTLFGFDGGDRWTSRKLLEILHFEEEKPVFGAPLFVFTDTTGKTEIKTRFFLEYRNDAVVRLNFNQDKNQIVYDHTRPYDDRYTGLQFTYIPDGTYEGFEFKKGKWQWVEKIYHYSIGHPDKPPIPNPKFGDRE